MAQHDQVEAVSVQFFPDLSEVLLDFIVTPAVGDYSQILDAAHEFLADLFVVVKHDPLLGQAPARLHLRGA